MKTPRQILFEHHSHAEPQLEKIQAQVLLAAQSAGRTKDSLLSPALSSLGGGEGEELAVWGASRSCEENSTPLFFHICHKLWLEVFCPARPIWAGFAMVWVVIFAINLETAPKMANSGPTPEGFLIAWKEQQNLIFELSNSSGIYVAERPKPVAPTPRSERPQFNLIG